MKHVYSIGFIFQISEISEFEPHLTPTEATKLQEYVANLDIYLEIDSEGRLRMKLYDKRDDFNVPIVNFPFICSNIPTTPAYSVTRKGPGSAYDKWNISVVICDTDIS
jgi:hypothetical protein